MNPSDSRTSRTFLRRDEPGVETLPRLRICALRMRVSISPRGSFIAMILASSPARLDQARNQALVAQFAQRDARHLHLAVEAARPAGHLATIAHANDRAVARQRREADARLEALLHRTRLVVGDVEQALAAGGEFLRQALLAQVILYRTLLCHSSAPFSASERQDRTHCRKGKLNSRSKAL